VPEIHLSVRRNGGNLDFLWNSLSGQSYRLRGSETLADPATTWPIAQEGISATPPTNTLGFPHCSPPDRIVKAFRSVSL